jgi:Zn-dependent metalloprotease
MRTRPSKLLVLLLVVSMLLPISVGAETRSSPDDPSNRPDVSIAPQTGKARFVRLTSEQAERLAQKAGGIGATEKHAAVFLREYGSLFGIQNASAELALVKTQTDHLGTTHMSYNQVYRGVPVFAGVLRLHFDAQGLVTAANGTFIPDIALDSTPSRSAAEAASTAKARVDSPGAVAVNTTLYVYRENLARGIPGANHLAYEVEVSNGRDVREFVYVDAHDGEIIDQITGIYDIDRNVYNQVFDSEALIWEEGDPLPFYSEDFTAQVNEDVNRVIDYAEDTYDMVSSASEGAFLSFDGLDSTMHSVVDSTMIACPNAMWNGTYTQYCAGVAGDDTVAHEWGHAYTEYTHDLIYAWQPGALNESYSDIFGEVVDLINGDGLDEPGGFRTAGACSEYTSWPILLTVTAPDYLAGDYEAGAAQFGPPVDGTLSGSLMIVDDGSGDTSSEGCGELVNDLTGKIAFIRRGNCDFVVKVKNAQDAGAVGAVVANHEDGGDSLLIMSGDDPEITIQSLFIGYTDGNAIEAEIPNDVDVEFNLDIPPVLDDSYRWLSGEDDPAFGGAIRDMWNPTCYKDPDKVTSEYYMCGTSDGGGVHTNSGVPNHAFALLVDGGSFNGYDVEGIGLTKAFHIYWRAESVYQDSASGFAAHADALESSCLDLTGIDLADLTTGEPSGQLISDADCAELADVIAAVELRTYPEQCGFEPLLDPDAPQVCGTATDPFFSESFDADPGEAWELTNEGVYEEYMERDWMWVDAMPGDMSGGFWAEDSLILGDCTPGNDDQSGVVYLDSPVITVPEGDTFDQAIVVFDHYVATEMEYDGGNVWISVNGRAWKMVKEEDFIFNAYNGTLASAADGNTNPLAGQAAFHGTDGGEVTGSWGQSQVDVSTYAGPGDEVRLRFAFGTDGCNGNDGWYLDGVEAYFCAAEAPTPTYRHRHRVNQHKPQSR